MEDPLKERQTFYSELNKYNLYSFPGTLPEYVTRHDLLLKEKEDWIEKAGKEILKYQIHRDLVQVFSLAYGHL